MMEGFKNMVIRFSFLVFGYSRLSLKNKYFLN